MPQFLTPHDDFHLDALLASCAEEPWNVELRLILADLLEEHGDPRAELYRLAVHSPDIKPWLRRWGDDWLGPDAVLWLKNYGERLFLEWDQDSVGKGASLLEEGWVNGLIARGAFGLAMVGEGKRLSEIALSSTSDISDDTLRRLRDLKALRGIDCSDWRSLSNHGVEAIAGLGTLKAVNLSRCTRLTKVSLQSLNKLKDLERLTIAGCTGLSMNALRSLSQMTALTHLGLASLDWLTDEALPTLTSLSNLEHLDVSHCPYVTDALLDAAASLPKLKSLAVAGTTILVDWAQRRAQTASQILDDSFFRVFLGVFSRQSIDIDHVEEAVSAGVSGITRVGLSKIASMKLLEVLDVRFSQQVDDDLLREFATLPNLRSLNLAYCEQFTATGLAALAGAQNLQSLSLMGNARLGDDAAEQLGTMQNLKVLVLDCPKISNWSVDQLRTQLLHCDIQHRPKQVAF